LSLRDTYLLKLLHWPTAPKTFWLIVTVASALGSVLLVRRGSSISIKPLRSFTSAFSTQNSRTLFLLSAVILYSLFIGIAGFLDRYLIWLLPLLMAVISIPIHSVRLYASTFPLVVAAILISLYALFALTSTHDYIAWNRARWQALTDLMQKDHISYQNIDGGFEFNGWYGYDAKFQPDSSKSWWWVKDDLYVISLGSIPGYAAIKQYPFNRWMPFGQGNIFLLKRVDAAINERAVVR
jgi:hypothetical protein